MHFKTIASLAMVAALAACGGGDDSPGTPVAPPNLSTPLATAGFYSGTTSNGRTAYGVLLETGAYWFVYTTAGSPGIIGGVVQGTASSIGGLYESGDAKDFNLEGLGVNFATISGAYVVKNSINATVRYNSGTTVQVRGVYDPSGEGTASLAALAGSYSGQAAFGSPTFAGTDTGTVTIAADGGYSTTTTGGCRVTGRFVPHPGLAVFDVSATTGAAPCAAPNITVNGVAFYNAATRQLLSAGLDTARQNGVLFLGNRL